MRFSVALLASFAATLLPTANAQQPATIQIVPLQSAACPVNLGVLQRSGVEVTRTDDGPQHAGIEARASKPDAPGQHLEIYLRPQPSLKPVASIEIAVRGVGVKRQLLPLDSFSGNSRADDLQQIFDLHRPAGSPALTRSDIRIPGINAVRWIELLSVTYADGTTWRPSASATCRTEPNRLLLVAGVN